MRGAHSALIGSELVFADGRGKLIDAFYSLLLSGLIPVILRRP